MAQPGDDRCLRALRQARVVHGRAPLPGKGFITPGGVRAGFEIAAQRAPHHLVPGEIANDDAGVGVGKTAG